MTTQTEALKLALEALEEAWYHVGTFQPTEKAIDLYDEARAAIKEALSSPNGEAQPAVAIEQRSISEHLEPVATLDDLEQEIYENTRQFVSRDVMEWMLKRYYTTPPQRTAAEGEDTRRAWVGLTIENIVALFPNEFLHSTYDTEKLISDVRIVEAKLKEKNTNA